MNHKRDAGLLEETILALEQLKGKADLLPDRKLFGIIQRSIDDVRRMKIEGAKAQLSRREKLLGHLLYFLLKL